METNFDYLKPVLGDELFTQFAEKMANADGITLANISDGSYVPKAKFDTEIAAKKQYSGQVTELSKQSATLTQQVEQLTQQLKDAQAEGANAKELQERVDKLTADLEAKTKLVSDSKTLNKQIQELTATVADRDKAIEYITKANRVSNMLRTFGARNPEVLLKMIDMSAVSEVDGKLTGLDEQVEAIKTSDPYLFVSEASPKGGVDDGGEQSARMKATGGTENQNINDELRRAAGREI